MTKFQITVLGIFVLCIVGGVASFALFKGSTSQVQLPSITVWGTISADTFNAFVTQINATGGQLYKINYVEESEANFNDDFVKALAVGAGPDAILIPQDMILANENKLLLIPYTAFPQRTFLDTYVPEANLYLRSDGITALPFSIDPLVMYWNRDMFTNAGIASAGTISSPLHWSQFPALGAKITIKDNNSNIRQSVVALGQFSNIDHAREILGTLLLQAGNPVTLRSSGNTSNTNAVISALGNGVYQGLNSSAAALAFFTRFTDPTDPAYSWNRSLPDSESFFLSGNLATYFGFASEISDIRSKNPNLNFDVAPVPQPDQGAVRTTYGRMYGFSLVKNSPNASAAYTILSNLTTPTALAQWSALTYLPPVRRDMISAGTTDPYLAIFYDAALISKDWLDPDPTGTSGIFQTMVDSVTSGSATLNDSIQNASDALDLSIKNI
jgi:ABC-type glycerol-3-phosphate transport system substrate-binding protein